MSQFFLCHNPLTIPSGNAAAYIYHYSKPRFFAHLLRLDYSGQPFKHLHLAGPNKLFIYKPAQGMEQLFVLVVDQNLDRASVKLPPALREAAIWYTTVLNKEDSKTYGKNSQASLLSDLNVLTPGLQILHLQKQHKFILSYPDGIKTFDDSAAMDAFCHNTLGYEHFQLEGGYFNAL